MGHDGGHELINLRFIAVWEIWDVCLAESDLVHPLFYCPWAAACANQSFFKCSNYHQAPLPVYEIIDFMTVVGLGVFVKGWFLTCENSIVFLFFIDLLISLLRGGVKQELCDPFDKSMTTAGSV